MKKEFNQKEYINNYKKEHYSPVKITLKKDEKVELDRLLKIKGITQTEFLRNAIEQLKKEIDGAK